MTASDQPQVITRMQVAGVTLGNALEFYDFLVFSFFAVQIGQCFFPATKCFFPARELFLRRREGREVGQVLGRRPAAAAKPHEGGGH